MSSQQKNSTHPKISSQSYLGLIITQIFTYMGEAKLIMRQAFRPLHWKGQIILQESLTALLRSHSCTHWGIRNEQLASVQLL